MYLMQCRFRTEHHMTYMNTNIYLNIILLKNILKIFKRYFNNPTKRYTLKVNIIITRKTCEIMTVRWGVVRCARPLLVLWLFMFERNEYFKLLTRLLYYFWKNARWISEYHQIFHVINGSKNIKCCEFCVKILYRESREIVKKSYGLGEISSNNCLKQTYSDQKYLILYYKIIFNLITPMLSL